MSKEGIRNWWGTAWVEKMERLAEPSRLGEGQKAARTGAVSTISFDGRTIAARVLCPKEQPYSVRISIDPFSTEQWSLLLAEVRDHGKLAASLAAGDLPFEINTAYAKANLPFMPARYVDLHLECACPDWLKPCRHLVAVWMKFARDFDRDPFLVFELRGLTRESLLALLLNRQPNISNRPGSDKSEAEEEIPEAAVPLAPENLPSDPDVFWAAPPLPVPPPESGERIILDNDIFEKLRDWPKIEAQFSQVYDAVYELATRIRR